MVNNTTGMQSAKSRLWECLQFRWLNVFNKFKREKEKLHEKWTFKPHKLITL